MKLIISILVTHIFVTTALTQTTKNRLNNDERNNYIEKHQNQLAVKLAITNNTEALEIHQQNLQYRLQQNSSIKTKLILSYRTIRFGIGYTPKFIPGNNDDLQKGKSDIFWAGTMLNLRHWTQRLEYANIKGFYLQESSSQNSGNNGSYINFPDLVYSRISGYTAYKLNPNFSFSAIETQTERQLRSAGSFVPGIVYRYYRIDDQTELTPDNSSQKSNNLAFSLQLGYFYSWVINKRLFLSASVSTGGGIIHSKLDTRYYTTTYKTKNTYPVFRAETMLAAGYNTKRFFTGMQFLLKAEEYKQAKTTATLDDNLQLQIYAGYRFDAPGFRNRFFDKK